jgi:hypothetical protein
MSTAWPLGDDLSWQCFLLLAHLLLLNPVWWGGMSPVLGCSDTDRAMGFRIPGWVRSQSQTEDEGNLTRPKKKEKKIHIPKMKLEPNEDENR